MQSVYVYLNDCDLIAILKMLFSCGLSLIQRDNGLLTTIHGISDKIERHEIGINAACYISFTPCTYYGKYLQPGSFQLQTTEDTQLVKAFSNLKKYLRSSFNISNDRSYYIGPSMYQEWLSGNYILPVLFDCKKFSVAKGYVDSILSMAIKYGFKIYNNNTKLRNMNSFDFPCDSFVIFKNANKLFSTTINRTSFAYLYGSECIFVYKNEKIHGYEFVLDSRINEEVAPELCMLFRKIETEIVSH